ncbi:unnamed protein product [Urochloa decumbens]|uniref:DUF6598 domain-containing protein n=1 Tax=Urochloa decumbens TaxID=240449 RepID=A0ABC9ERL3_9POAL
MPWWAQGEGFWKKSDSEGEGVAERERLAAETFAGWQRRKAEDERADQERDKPAPPYIAYPCDTLQIFSAKVAGIRGGLHWPLHVFGIVALRDSVDYNRNVIFHRTRDKCQILTEKDPYLVLTGPTRSVAWFGTVTIEVVLKVKGTVQSEDRDLSFLAVPIRLQSTLDSFLFKRGYTSMLSTLKFTLGHIVYSVEATIFVRVIDGSWMDEFHGLFAASTESIARKKIVLLYSKAEKIVVADDGNIKLSRSVASVETEGMLKVSVRAWAASGGANNALENELVASESANNALEDELVASGGANDAVEAELVASGGDNHAMEGELVASKGANHAVEGELVTSGGANDAVQGELAASGGANDAVEGELAASGGDNNVVEDELVFTPKEYDRSYGTLNIGFCKMEVTVAWSLVSSRLADKHS